MSVSFLLITSAVADLTSTGRHTATATATATSSSSSSSGDAAQTSSSKKNKSNRVNTKKQANSEHPEDPEREDGKWMRKEGNKRKTVEEEEESMLRKTGEVPEGVGESRGEEGIGDSGGRGLGGSE